MYTTTLHDIFFEVRRKKKDIFFEVLNTTAVWLELFLVMKDMEVA